MKTDIVLGEIFQLHSTEGWNSMNLLGCVKRGHLSAPVVDRVVESFASKLTKLLNNASTGNFLNSTGDPTSNFTQLHVFTFVANNGLNTLDFQIVDTG
jgi:hypothetical protein